MLKEEDFDNTEDWLAYGEARRIFRTSDLVLTTGWTFEELRRQPRQDIDELITFLNIKSAIEREQQDLSDSRSTG